MGSIGRYIFRTTFGAFLVVLISVTALMWITQALRDIDLMTNQGQTILVFVGITGLIIPLLVLIIAPIALMIAVAHVLIKLSNDSELIVINAAGLPPWHVFRPFLAVAIVVSLMVAAISVYISPKCLRELRSWAAHVRADLVTNVAQPGRFTVLSGRLTLHMQARRPNGQLVGVFVDDQRNPRERMTILAEYGNILKNEHGTFLLLENGSVQRQEVGQRDPHIVEFDRNAFDLSRLTAGPTSVRYSVRERYLWELINPVADDPQFSDRPDQVRAELHDRITAPFYPLALVLVTFAYLGAPRTTRQSRAMSLVGAIAVVALLRGLGFVGTVAGPHMPILLIVPYLALLAAFVLSFWAISRGVIIEPPAFINNAITALLEQLKQRYVTALGPAR